MRWTRTTTEISFATTATATIHAGFQCDAHHKDRLHRGSIVRYGRMCSISGKCSKSTNDNKYSSFSSFISPPNIIALFVTGRKLLHVQQKCINGTNKLCNSLSLSMYEVQIELINSDLLAWKFCVNKFDFVSNGLVCVTETLELELLHRMTN